MSSFETEKPSSEPGGCRRLQKLLQKNLKKFLTKANEFDKINELLIERTAKKFERASKNKLKKFLTNEKLCDKINELIRVGTAEILDN
ncbi:hypothetical protein [Fusicatenibacter sp.]